MPCTAINPSDNPLHDMFFTLSTTSPIAGLSVIISFIVITQVVSATDFIVTEMAPANKLVTVLSFKPPVPLLHLKINGASPLVTLAVIDPAFPPLHPASIFFTNEADIGSGSVN